MGFSIVRLFIRYRLLLLMFSPLLSGWICGSFAQAQQCSGCAPGYTWTVSGSNITCSKAAVATEHAGSGNCTVTGCKCSERTFSQDVSPSSSCSISSTLTTCFFSHVNTVPCNQNSCAPGNFADGYDCHPLPPPAPTPTGTYSNYLNCSNGCTILVTVPPYNVYSCSNSGDTLNGQTCSSNTVSGSKVCPSGSSLSADSTQCQVDPIATEHAGSGNCTVTGCKCSERTFSQDVSPSSSCSISSTLTTCFFSHVNTVPCNQNSCAPGNFADGYDCHPLPPPAPTPTGTYSNYLNCSNGCTILVTVPPYNVYSCPATPANFTYNSVSGKCEQAPTSCPVTATPTPAILSAAVQGVPLSEIVPTQTAQQTFIITNSGGTQAQGCTPTVTSSTATPMYSVDPNSCPTVNSNNGTCSVTVTATAPSSPDSTNHSGTFNFSCSVGGTSANPMVSISSPLNLSFTNPANFTYASSLYNFPDTTVNLETSPQNVTIKNTGGINLSGCALSFSEPTDFTVDTSSCTPMSLNSSGGCTATIKGSPKATGPFSGKFTFNSCSDSMIASSVLSSGNFTVTGLPSPTPSLSVTQGVTAVPSNSTFSNFPSVYPGETDVYVGDPAPSPSFTITNSGGADATNCSITVTNNPGTSAFSLGAMTCSNPGSISFNSPNYCTFNVNESTATSGTFNGAVTVSCSNASYTFNLNGKVTTPPSCDSTNHAFRLTKTNVCECVPPYQNIGSPQNPVCTQIPTGALTCDSTSPVSKSIPAGASFATLANKKLACCMNQYTILPSGLPAPTPSKFDCVDNSASAKDFNSLWAGTDAITTQLPANDANNLNALVLVNSGKQFVTGFFRTDGARCNEFSEFAGVLQPAVVNPVILSSQQNKISGAVPAPSGTPIPLPSGNYYSALNAAMTTKKLKVPTTAVDMNRCPILVRAAMVSTCPNNGALPYVQNSFKDANGIVHCESASSITVHIRGEQIYQVEGQPVMAPFDTVMSSQSARSIDMSTIIQNKNGSTCENGAKKNSSGICTYQ